MNPEQESKRMIRSSTKFFVTLMLGLFCAQLSFAQVPPRFYWKSLKDSNGFPVIFQSLSGNANPADSSRRVSEDAEFEAELMIAGYARMFELFDRSTTLALLLPMGRVSSDVTVGGRTVSDNVSGIGDPMIEFDINIIGPKAIDNLPDLMRYEPGFSMDIIVDLVIPIGEYDDDESLNIGQNRWSGRIGVPIVWQFGPWIPGKRMTLEMLPSVWFYEDNDDFLDGTLETDPLFLLENHLTRDFTSEFWGSFDATWAKGGEATIDGVTGDEVDNFGVGFTFGYAISDNLSLTAGYMTTVGNDELEMDRFLFSVTYGWNSLVEGIKRLGH